MGIIGNVSPVEVMRYGTIQKVTDAVNPETGRASGLGNHVRKRKIFPVHLNFSLMNLRPVLREKWTRLRPETGRASGLGNHIRKGEDFRGTPESFADEPTSGFKRKADAAQIKTGRIVRPALNKQLL